MHWLLEIAKYAFIGISCAAVLYGYWLLFFDEEWDWSPPSLLKDIIITGFLVMMFLVWPFRSPLFRRTSPMRFLLGGAVLIGLMGLMVALTLNGWNINEFI